MRAGELNYAGNPWPSFRLDRSKLHPHLVPPLRVRPFPVRARDTSDALADLPHGDPRTSQGPPERFFTVRHVTSRAPRADSIVRNGRCTERRQDSRGELLAGPARSMSFVGKLIFSCEKTALETYRERRI